MCWVYHILAVNFLKDIMMLCSMPKGLSMTGIIQQMTQSYQFLTTLLIETWPYLGSSTKSGTWLLLLKTTSSIFWDAYKYVITGSYIILNMSFNILFVIYVMLIGRSIWIAVTLYQWLGQNSFVYFIDSFELVGGFLDTHQLKWTWNTLFHVGVRLVSFWSSSSQSAIQEWGNYGFLLWFSEIHH